MRGDKRRKEEMDKEKGLDRKGKRWRYGERRYWEFIKIWREYVIKFVKYVFCIVYFRFYVIFLKLKVI